MPKPPFASNVIQAVREETCNFAKPREEILDWILNASEDDRQWFYAQVVLKHRVTIERILNENADDTQAEGIGVDQNTTAVVPLEKIAEETKDPATRSELSKAEQEDLRRSNALPPIVQFSSSMYFCSLDEESTISLDVIRIGNLSKPSEVSFTTVDASAKAGEKFVQTSGRIKFPAGSNGEEIQIKLIKSAHWDTTTEFKVELQMEPKPANCTPGRYLYLSRVKVIDGNCFPTNKYRDAIQTRNLTSIPFWGLLREYFKLNYDHPVIRKGTKKMFLNDLTHELYFLLKLYMNVYMVDMVLKERPGDEHFHLFGIAILLIVPFACLHFLDFRETTWKVGGASRGMLQNALLRKFLNYAENCRKDLKSADLIMAMTRDTTNVVHEGYIKMLELTKCVTQLCMILLFQVTAPFVFPNGSFNPFGFIVLFIFPPILFTFLICRRHITTHHIGRRNDEQDNLVATVGRTVDNYRLVADFGQRPFFEERFQHRISEFNGAGKEAAQVLKNNGYFSPWVTILFTAYYIIVGGLEVVDGVNKPKSERLSLGMFLANLSIIATIGHSWGDIYKVLMDMQSISPALLSVVDLMNLPTDVPQRKALNRVRRIKSKDLREEMRSSGVKGHPADTMPIVLENLSYSYREPEATDEVAVPVATKGVLSTDIPPAFTMTGVVKFHQGHFTALVGPEGEGKSTLLKMLGGVILPTPGALFVPSHLRVLHVAKEDLFFKASLYDNLTFGCIPGDSDAELKRVCTICSRLGLPEDMMALVRQGSEGTVLTWGEVISQSQKSLLGLARAVITNPELMCIHKPIMAYNEETSKIVLDMLKQFCIDKGVEQELESRHVRRPRTCIITAAKASSVKVADFVYWVSHKDGVRYISKSEANEMAFGGSGKSC